MADRIKLFIGKGRKDKDAHIQPQQIDFAKMDAENMDFDETNVCEFFVFAFSVFYFQLKLIKTQFCYSEKK